MKRTSSTRDLTVILCPDTGILQRPTADFHQTDVILFPELVDGGYRALARGEGKHTIHDEYVNQFRRLSREATCMCIGGTVALRGSGRKTTNTCLVYQRGRLLHRYDKIHLFKPGGDAQYFLPGTRFGTFPMGGYARGLKAGIIICYDLRFPELTRALAQNGIGVLFVPARWPSVRDDAWRSLLKARAIENQIFVVGCNARGREGGFSYVFDPFGKVVFSSRVDPTAPYYKLELNLSLLEEAKRFHNNLADARLLKRIRIPSRVIAQSPRP
jgi:omega-amidase